VEHPSFYCSSRLTLNVTREPMAELGYCPSGRLFEAAACGIPVLTDDWKGLDTFFRVGEELLVARTTEDTLEALSRSPEELARIGRAARERALTEHTATRRAEELVELMETTLTFAAEPEPILGRS
jgi:spore maturation protein CgeB